MVENSSNMKVRVSGSITNAGVLNRQHDEEFGHSPKMLADIGIVELDVGSFDGELAAIEGVTPSGM